MSDINIIKCEYENIKWDSTGNYYACTVSYTNFNKTRKYQFDTTDCRDVNEVTLLVIQKSNMPSIPKDFPWNQFPNLEIVSIDESRMETVCKDDLKGLANVKNFRISTGYIRRLPGDLFDNMDNLESVSFEDNKIEIIDPGLIEKFMSLDNLDLMMNRNIDLHYSSNNKGNATLQKIKREILKSCQTPHIFAPGFLEERIEWYRNDNLKLIDENEKLHVQNIRMKERIERLEKRLARAQRE